MKSPDILLRHMRKVLDTEGIREVAACGEFMLSAGPPTLFPGAVYGFAVRLTEGECMALFNEASGRDLARMSTATMFRPIEADLYPLYWGKDKQLGARPYQHLNNPEGTGAIRLSTYQSLRGKKIVCATLVVSSYVDAERAMQRTYPDLLKTTNTKL